ncbi:MAG: CBS domain-containing protein [Gammaproteobacteria bacterium]|nr:CBS domain-containing protein [Gammaproteobacteria bacterium]MBU1979100.1 CBS domain-containing protein [Gammaproteobacteria bacterium]
MTIRSIPCFPPSIELRLESSLLDALKLMLEKHINHLPLCDENGRFTGIVSTQSILSELIPVSARMEHGLADLKFAGDATRLLCSHLHGLEHRTVGELAEKHMPVLDEDCPLLEAALLLSQNTSPLPVIGKDGRLRGMLSRRTLLAYIVQQAGV